MARSERFVQSKEEFQQLVRAEKRKSERRATRRAAISRALARAKKTELIDFLLQLVDDDEEVALWLEEQLDLERETSDEALDIELDIVKATQVPEHLINYNFPYDHAAYARIAKALKRLVRDGHLHAAMQLSEKLLLAGSHQVAMNDESLMTEEIVDCLRPVCQAVAAARLNDQETEQWFTRMHRADETGFVWNSVRRRKSR